MKLLAGIFIILMITLPSFADETVGNIKKMSGSVTVLRGEKTISAEPGIKLVQGDIVRTAQDSSAGIIFKDSTIFSLGADSEIIINQYTFSPKDEKYAFSMHMKKGTAVYESGRMGKLAPEAVKIHTPKATIGVRGTKFLVEVEE
ncbi:MAG: FecR domain-containing protein [Deferribacterales bacterium]